MIIKLTNEEDGRDILVNSDHIVLVEPKTYRTGSKIFLAGQRYINVNETVEDVERLITNVSE